MKVPFPLLRYSLWPPNCGGLAGEARRTQSCFPAGANSPQDAVRAREVAGAYRCTQRQLAGEAQPVAYLGERTGAAGAREPENIETSALAGLPSSSWSNVCAAAATC